MSDKLGMDRLVYSRNLCCIASEGVVLCSGLHFIILVTDKKEVIGNFIMLSTIFATKQHRIP